MKKIKSEDLKCGNVFQFRDVFYLCLLSFTDERHTQTVITCVPWEEPTIRINRGGTAGNIYHFRSVVALRLFRTFEVTCNDEVYSIPLQVLDNSKAELDEVADIRR